MARAIRFTPPAWEDYLRWQGQDKKTLKRIDALIAAAVREHFADIGDACFGGVQLSKLLGSAHIFGSIT